MKVILGDSDLDIRIKVSTLIDVTTSNLEYAGVWEGDAKLTKKLEMIQMEAARKIVGCSKTVRNAALRADLDCTY